MNRWQAVVSALDAGESFRSRVSVYQHPLAGRMSEHGAGRCRGAGAAS